MRICAFEHCSNSTYKLNKWKTSNCEIHHDKKHKNCGCSPPFSLFPFPTVLEDEEIRKEWIKQVNRKNPKTGKNWQPTSDSRICSIHFSQGKPTAIHPSPDINLSKGDVKVDKKLTAKRRDPPKERGHTSAKRRKVVAQIIEEASEEEDDVAEQHILEEHDYTSHKPVECECVDCSRKDIEISLLKVELEKAHRELNKCNIKKTIEPDLVDVIQATDAKIRAYTGLPNKDGFENLCSHISKKANKTRFWCGLKKTVIQKKRKGLFSRRKVLLTTKRGPGRKLSVKKELLLTLVKLRLALPNELLGDIFKISKTLVSKVVNTMIKILASELKPLIYWPERDILRQCIPKALKSYTNLCCTIDCSEVFIDRPRQLEVQALTWSDYKKHNTIKFLVAIAPNGMICFLSRLWGGRASDQLITRNSGFLNHMEPGDLVLADRGFTIREDLLQRGATLKIPPSSSGLEQMSRENVKITKKVANARIHVERAIGRMKTFTILKNVLPITLLPLADDIVSVCACLCNLMPPLV